MPIRPLSEEADHQKQRGVLLILTGPTGSGKDTILTTLHETDPSNIRIITTTSRERRPHESEGNPYYFISREDFEKKIAEKLFFEWVDFRGELYGTQRKTLDDALSSGKNIIWRIDIKGVKNIKEKIKTLTKRVVFVFLASPITILKQRVIRDEGEENYLKRWHESLVMWEMEQYDDCDYLLVNEEGQLESTVMSIRAIMEAKKLEIIRDEA